MDLLKIIHDLQQERNKLDTIILSLEQLQGDDSLPRVNSANSRRGRRSMDAAGRLEVSRRMKKYWENRRKENGFEQPESNTNTFSADQVISF
jgi:hypothetical protein